MEIQLSNYLKIIRWREMHASLLLYDITQSDRGANNCHHFKVNIVRYLQSS